MSSTTSSAPSATSSAASAIVIPSNLKVCFSQAVRYNCSCVGPGASLQVVGIILAIVSGLLIGSSFVFKKKGLLRSQADGAVAGEGVAYLKSVSTLLTICAYRLIHAHLPTAIMVDRHVK